MLRSIKWLSFILLFQSVNARPPPAVAEDQTGDIYAGLDPWMLVIIVVGIVACFLIGLSILVRRWYKPTGESIVIGDFEDQSPRQTGLDQATIDTCFPVFCYSSAAIQRYSVTDCTVCLSEFSDDEMLRLIPKCNHIFHTDCIDLWLKSRNSCPICRAKLDDPPPETAESFSEVEIIEDRGNHNDSAIRINEVIDMGMIVDISRDAQVLRRELHRSNSTSQLLDLGSRRLDARRALTRSKTCARG